MTETPQKPIALVHLLYLVALVFILGGALAVLVQKMSLSDKPLNDSAHAQASDVVMRFPVSVAQTVQVMLDGQPRGLSDLTFHPHDTGLPQRPQNDVFNPQGGHILYQLGDTAWSLSGRPMPWIFSLDGAVAGMGTPAPDLVAFLPGMKDALCRAINVAHGIGDIVPRAEKALAIQNRSVAQTVAAPVFTLGGQGNAAALDGHPYGCFEDPAQGFVYYHTLAVQ